MQASTVKPGTAVLLDQGGHVVKWFGCAAPRDLCDSFMAEEQEQAIGRRSPREFGRLPDAAEEGLDVASLWVKAEVRSGDPSGHQHAWPGQDLDLSKREDKWYEEHLARLGKDGIRCTKVGTNGKPYERFVYLDSRNLTLEIRGGRSGTSGVMMDDLVDIRQGLSSPDFQQFVARLNMDPPRRGAQCAVATVAMAASNIQRLALYHSGRAEAVYSDGSAAILHPSAKARTPAVTYFACNGVRQRLLSPCLPREFCGKILAAATIRDRFHPMPSVLSSPAKKRLRRLQPLTHVVWPACDMGTQRHEDGSVSIESLDRNCKLLLAPHGRTYVVEWWQPSIPSTDRESRPMEENVELENVPKCPTATESFGTSLVGYEHIYQVQCFYVEHVDIPWLYPLFLALMQHAQHAGIAVDVHPSTRRLVGLKAMLEDCLATGQLVDSGQGLTAPLPPSTPSTPSTPSMGKGGLDGVGNACDHVSPAVCMGEVSLLTMSMARRQFTMNRAVLR
eukprot:s1781_g10.t1